jgi:tetratricopeptide (TPR) repeat protein
MTRGLPKEISAAADRREQLRLALSRLHAGAFAAAARLVEPLYHAQRDDFEALLLLGLALAGCGHPDLAADMLDEVARRRPDAPHPAGDAIRLLEEAGQTAAIGEYLDAAMACAPGDARIWATAGGWRQERGEPEPARPLLEKAIALQPELWAAHVSLAAAQADAGQIEAAMRRLRAVIGRGGGGVAARANLAVMLGVIGRHEEALGHFEMACRAAPGHAQIAVNHGIALLKSGRLAEGWSHFNRRLELPRQALLSAHGLLPAIPPGMRLDGKVILVTHDAGLGDSLQFARYLPILAATGARVLLWVPEPLRRLLAGVAGVSAVFSDDLGWPAFDWHCPIIRLAEVFGTTLRTIPATVPYLHADPGLVTDWAEHLPPRDGRKRIGLVWAGSARENTPQLAAIDRRRSLAPSALAPLLAVPGVAWVSLQLGRAAPDFPLHDPMGAVRDFADTAAILASLDALVSVDTSVVHLAGGMGVPVFLLDRYDNCWRWLSGREDSPWYPSLRIFRQPAWGDWDTPIRRVAAALC